MIVRKGEMQARWLALLVPAALLAGAYVSQWRGLVPCEMCWWQRYAHFAALPPALLGLLMRRPAGLARTFTALAALAILASGAIGVFHAGVENHWWEGLTRCAVPARHGGDFLADIMNTPLVRCDEAQWRFIGISLAGWNAIISIPFALWILWQTLLHRR